MVLSDLLEDLGHARSRRDRELAPLARGHDPEEQRRAEALDRLVVPSYGLYSYGLNSYGQEQRRAEALDRLVVPQQPLRLAITNMP